MATPKQAIFHLTWNKLILFALANIIIGSVIGIGLAGLRDKAIKSKADINHRACAKALNALADAADNVILIYWNGGDVDEGMQAYREAKRVADVMCSDNLALK